MTVTDQRPLTTSPQPRALAPHDPQVAVRMTASVARSAVEISRDLRPPTSLARLVVPEVMTMLTRRASLSRRLRGEVGRAPEQRIAVTGVRTCIVNEQTVEASAVVREPGRARFLALRWELRHTGWRVTVLELG
ncbi:hypothetical protein JSY14_02860 [Brachybacterium sp. EF45031]|uniref:Rv3235 family protein n=1 Tax=Brachybacterium sillae TaxID=2810536 RepID=UPI00217E63A2|nr:Rv3235 family protein [Brachybacterium sillae]MCS6711005.1 hypothetical protein [Brachybacterium sillae]